MLACLLDWIYLFVSNLNFNWILYYFFGFWLHFHHFPLVSSIAKNCDFLPLFLSSYLCFNFNFNFFNFFLLTFVFFGFFGFIFDFLGCSRGFKCANFKIICWLQFELWFSFKMLNTNYSLFFSLFLIIFSPSPRSFFYLWMVMKNYIQSFLSLYHFMSNC